MAPKTIKTIEESLKQERQALRDSLKALTKEIVNSKKKRERLLAGPSLPGFLLQDLL